MAQNYKKPNSVIYIKVLPVSNLLATKSIANCLLNKVNLKQILLNLQRYLNFF